MSGRTSCLPADGSPSALHSPSVRFVTPTWMPRRAAWQLESENSCAECNAVPFTSSTVVKAYRTNEEIVTLLHVAAVTAKQVAFAVAELH